MPETVLKTIAYTIDELIAMVVPTGYAYPAPFYQIISNENLVGECFRKYPDNDGIEVSNLGRVRYNNAIVPQLDDTDKGTGWLFVKIDRVLEKTYVYRLVAKTWMETPSDLNGWEVHHITNNGFDNRPENLIWIIDSLHRKIPTPKL